MNENFDSTVITTEDENVAWPESEQGRQAFLENPEDEKRYPVAFSDEVRAS